MKINKRRNDSVQNVKADAVEAVEEKSPAEIADNLELNAISVAPFVNKAKGIANYVMADPRVTLYEAKGFTFEYKDQDSSAGDLYYNIVIYDTEKSESEKNEVERINVLKSVEGNVELNENFTNLFWKIKSAIYSYIVDKRLNYFDKKQNAVAEASNPNKYREKAAAMRAQAKPAA